MNFDIWYFQSKWMSNSLWEILFKKNENDNRVLFMKVMSWCVETCLSKENNWSKRGWKSIRFESVVGLCFSTHFIVQIDHYAYLIIFRINISLFSLRLWHICIFIITKSEILEHKNLQKPFERTPSVLSSEIFFTLNSNDSKSHFFL